MEKLNKLDLQILRIVSRNARMSIKDIAEECGSSRSAVNQRLQRLMASGVVKDPGYAVNPRAIGYNTCTYVGIRLERGSLYKDVVPLLQEIEEIVECHYTTGQYSILVKLYALDNRDLMRILNGIIQEIPGVTGTETLISLDLSFERSIHIPKSIE
ncbi:MULTISPECIES: Lrp/AsnC family transcriptional regulator [unclassified Porphyromonas]|uniref:Lrp/AsnC family transcriptional regulator n=1 Tax=unclassified Porphyromonas TaxID=2645799 RepID=UPI00052C1BDD|nr:MULTISPECIES: Lrp/AsnC family transcriptional regulator [unclassified Porphyromonas]KGN85728.1 transcriptional regulator [Porphyromonas sp. COT-290 OH860]KGO01670.1 transcriptional regulator [Porphyromonas sp. COT-290 OH3588]